MQRFPSDIAVRLVYDVAIYGRNQTMKEFFSFDNFAFTFIIGLIVFSWLSFLSVIFFG